MSYASRIDFPDYPKPPFATEGLVYQWKLLPRFAQNQPRREYEIFKPPQYRVR